MKRIMVAIKELTLHPVFLKPNIRKGFYLASGFGSRGFTTAPLCSRMLVEEILNGRSYFPADFRRHLHQRVSHNSSFTSWLSVYKKGNFLKKSPLSSSSLENFYERSMSLVSQKSLKRSLRERLSSESFNLTSCLLKRSFEGLLYIGYYVVYMLEADGDMN